MVHYPLPKYIKKSALRNAPEFTWSDAAKRTDQDAVVATCMRCAQNLVKLPNDCDKAEERRCDHCKDGNRGGCTLVSYFQAVLLMCALTDMRRCLLR
jgi:hypothetical protein